MLFHALLNFLAYNILLKIKDKGNWNTALTGIKNGGMLKKDEQGQPIIYSNYNYSRSVVLRKFPA